MGRHSRIHSNETPAWHWAQGGWLGLGALSLCSGLAAGITEALDIGGLDDNLTLPIINSVSSESNIMVDLSDLDTRLRPYLTSVVPLASPTFISSSLILPPPTPSRLVISTHES
ncbi:Phosphatidate cytidylyltransferase [Rhizoctonia solani]|uniref:Phosphatidate cytidylyltransferase n=1 Tax=Rhizoctonia solani TaxID=456999 RepID=A0A8H7IC42_9AGAM|nr:Phosphatidate cytidylyltransferase [Rhizoctonia solani]